MAAAQAIDAIVSADACHGAELTKPAMRNDVGRRLTMPRFGGERSSAILSVIRLGLSRQRPARQSPRQRIVVEAL